MPRHSPFVVTLSGSERVALEARARKYTSSYRDVIRAKIVLLAAQGPANDVIAARLDAPRQIVSKWRKRFCEHRLPGLDEQPRGGRHARFSPQPATRSSCPRRNSFSTSTPGCGKASRSRRTITCSVPTRRRAFKPGGAVTPRPHPRRGVSAGWSMSTSAAGRSPLWRRGTCGTLASSGGARPGPGSRPLTAWSRTS